MGISSYHMRHVERIWNGGNAHIWLCGAPCCNITYWYRHRSLVEVFQLHWPDPHLLQHGSHHPGFVPPAPLSALGHHLVFVR